jgi:hypothetical protein
MPAPEAAVDEALNPDNPAWKAAPTMRVHFNRTPPAYATDPKDDGQRPVLNVQLLRQPNDDVILRAHWLDSSEDEATIGIRYPDAGEGHIYKQHSAATNAFPDAFCVMVPQLRGPHSSYPSMMMGDSAKPVDLFYWKAGGGFELLNAHGRTSTTALAKEVLGAARRDTDGWTVTMVLPELTSQTPVCFAVWNGNKEHRDGLKYFSLWYEVE